MEEILQKIPELFEINLNTDKDGISVFEKLTQFIKFDEAFIYFLNPNSLQLKYSYKKHANYCVNDVFSLSNTVKEQIYSKKSEILFSDSDIIKSVKLGELKKKSYIIAKLNIKSTVFGIILLAKKEYNYYQQKDTVILNAVAGIISYVLKDLELSNVFKLQLDALKNGLLEKQEAYKTIKQQNETILESEKTKNEFLANISHELRTPLNSILGFTDMLDSKLCGDLNQKQRDFLNDIKVASTHLLGMINEILDMSKLEANAMKLVKSEFLISVAIQEVCNIISPLAIKKKIQIKTNIVDDFKINADYQKIQQILFNLMSNAVKYSQDNGIINISAKNKDETAIIVVQDNGIGIDKKYHGKIFAKFVQLDSAYTKKESSTGLGLAITKELVELHGGKISIKSEINKGSSFIIEIPLK